MLVQEIQSFFLQGRRESIVKQVRWEQNIVIHFLANFGRIKERTDVWLQSGPDEVPDLVMQTWPPLDE